MKQLLHLKSLLIAIFVLFGGGSVSAQDETIYTEDFGTDSKEMNLTTYNSNWTVVSGEYVKVQQNVKYGSSGRSLQMGSRNNPSAEVITPSFSGSLPNEITFSCYMRTNKMNSESVTLSVEGDGTITDCSGAKSSLADGKVTVTFKKDDYWYPVSLTLTGCSSSTKIRIQNLMTLYVDDVTVKRGVDPRTPVTLTYSADKYTTATEEGEITGAPTLNVNPEEAAQYLVFSSDNEEVAKIEGGKLIAVSKGTANITASISGNATYRDIEDSYMLIVGIPSSNLSYKSESETVTYGDDFTAPKLDYTYGYNGTISYTSSNPSVATVNENGEVTILAVGEATITANGPDTDNYKASEASFTLTVNDIQGSATGALLFKETFDLIGGNGGNDNRWSGSGTASSDLHTNGDKQNTDENGWSVTRGYGGKQCARFGTGDYKGKAITREIPVKVDQDYTLYFNAAPWGTESAKINVTVTGGTITESNFPTESMTKEAWNELWATITPTASTIKITFSASMKRFFLDEIKVIDPDKTEEVTIPSSGWGTYCSKWPLDLTEESLPDGFKAYAVSSTSSSEATLTQITEKIIGGTGIIINGTPGATYAIKVADKGTAYSGTNLLTGTLAPTYIEEGQYFLKSGTFVYSKAGTLPKNKAYLKSDGTGTQGAKLSFLFDTTSIEQVKVETSDAWYDLSGRKVNPSANVKGVYIHNGKKVVK